MENYVISGGKPLYGEVTISGGKNAVCPILAATAMVKGVCIIENVPEISDVYCLIDILKSIGADVSFIDKTTLRVDGTKIETSSVANDKAVRKMRASYYVIGALLGRFSSARVGLPGGCDFGVRPIDQHIKGFEALGASVVIEHGIVNAQAEKLIGTNIYMDVRSVGATINIMLAATLAEGTTLIENANKEPHIVDTANFLNALGADIKGAGTDIIKIKGVKSLHGGTYAIIPDQIEAGTFMVAAAATGGRVAIKNVIPKHLETIASKLIEAGVKVEEFDDYVVVSREPGKPIKKTNVKTLPYPGFPTDMQPQMTTLLCLAKGTSVIVEDVYDHRFRYIDELRRMGAKAEVDGKVCVIEGIDSFMGATVQACDLRGGVAMVIAGLCASGITTIQNISHMERGYEHLVEKLISLGANIKKVEIDDVEDIAVNKIS